MAQITLGTPGGHTEKKGKERAIAWVQMLVGGTQGSTYSLREMILQPLQDRDPGA